MKRIFLLLLALSLSACTSISLSTPTPIIETPELVGESGTLGFGARVQSDQVYEATDNASSRPPDLTAPKVASGISALGGAHLNLLRRLKLGLNVDPNTDPLGVGTFATAQLQLIGSDRNTAKRGSFSFSVFGHAGNSTVKESGDQSSTFGAGGNNWSAEIKSDWYDFGLSAGYRVADSTLIFVGVSKQIILIRSKIDQYGGSGQQGTYTATDRGEGNKAAIGISWISERGEVYLAADYTDYRYHKAAPSFAPSGMLGFIYR